MITNTLWGEEELESKICKTCGEDRLLTEFYAHKNFKDGLDSRCRSCDSARLRLRTKLTNHPDTPPKPKVCDCCDKNPQDKQYPKPIVLDHDHKTMLFRGWLCDDCNLGLGKLGDNLEGIMKAMKYLVNVLDSNEKEKAKKYIIRLVESI